VASGNGITFSFFFLSSPSVHPLDSSPIFTPRHRQTLGRDVWRTTAAAPGGKRQNRFGALNPAHLYYNNILYIYIHPKAQLYTLIMPDSFPPSRPSTTHRTAILPLSFLSPRTKVAALFPLRINGLYVPFYINWTPAHFTRILVPPSPAMS